jgi:hypothetical protein
MVSLVAASPTHEEIVAERNAKTRALLADDESFQLSAQMMKKRFDTLIAVGFSREEAVSIVSRKGSSVSFTEK